MNASWLAVGWLLLAGLMAAIAVVDYPAGQRHAGDTCAGRLWDHRAPGDECGVIWQGDVR